MLKPQELRCYTLSHYMLSPMAKGIQTLHSTIEMYNKYIHSNDADQLIILNEWAKNHKTVISLDGGISSMMDEWKYFLEDPENFYPWSTFHEDEESLHSLLTAISIVLPEKIYNTAAYMRYNKYEWDRNSGSLNYIGKDMIPDEELATITNYGRFSLFEMDLIDRLIYSRLAS